MSAQLIMVWLVVAGGRSTSSDLISFTTVQFGDCGPTGDLSVCSGDSYLRLVPRAGVTSDPGQLFRISLGADVVWPVSRWFFSAAIDHAWGGLTRLGPVVTLRTGKEAPFWVGIRTDLALTRAGAGVVFCGRAMVWPPRRNESGIRNRLTFHLETGYSLVPEASGARGLFIQASIALFLDNPL